MTVLIQVVTFAGGLVVIGLFCIATIVGLLVGQMGDAEDYRD